MANTTKNGLPYPLGAVTPFVHLDVKSLAEAVDGRVITYCTEATPSDTRPTGAARYEGAVIYCTDTRALGFWDAGSARWRMYDGRWRTWSPSWTSTGGVQPAIGNGTLEAKYLRQGAGMHLKFLLAVGTTTINGQGSYLYTPPPGFVFESSEQYLNGSFFMAGSGWFPLIVKLQSGGLQPFAPVDSQQSVMSGLANSDNVGTAGTGIPDNGAGFTMTPGCITSFSGVVDLA